MNHSLAKPSCLAASVSSVVLVLALVFAPVAAGEPLCVDPQNPQYFLRGTSTIALVGYSAEFICHIPMPNHIGDFCTYEAAGQNIVGHKDYINDLAAKGLNVFRLWIVLNHSPGSEPVNGGTPYANEQPFHRNAQGKWSVSPGQWDAMFFSHIYDVVSYAASKNVYVEVTLFDPWQGTWELGPWHQNNIVNGTGFSNERDFITLPPGGTCANSFASGPRKRQVDVVKKLADTLNPLDNFYWEIANEPDISASNPATGSEVAAWHDCMIQELYNYEGTLPNGRHMIGVNYHTIDAINTIKNNTYPVSSPKVKVMNAHYVDFADASRQGAIELIRNYNNGPSGNLNRLFGFNETHISPNITAGQNADTTRAEAWEFMFHEGGVYNHMGFRWNTSTEAATVRTQLGKLATYLNGRDLMRMKRSTGNPPSWAPGLPAYGSNDQPTNPNSPRIYWAAMEGPNHRLLYLHHSTWLGGAFKHYGKPASITRLTQLMVSLPADNYQVVWIRPSDLAVLGTSSISGGTQTLTVPSYSYDISLRIIPSVLSVVSRSCHITCCAAY